MERTPTEPLIVRIRRALSGGLSGSLPARIVVLIVSASVVILTLGGVVLYNQTLRGVYDGKKQSAVGIATSALTRMQQTVRQSGMGNQPFYDTVARVADDTATQSDQYLVVIQGPVAEYVSPGLVAGSVPSDMREAVSGGEGLAVAPTQVRYTTSDHSEPGIVVGGKLQAFGSSLTAPVYFIFPLTTEVEMMTIVRNALITTGLLLLMALGFLSLGVARQAAGPIRDASRVAGKLAQGELSERMSARGDADLAVLGASMNRMAESLETHIGQLEELSRVQSRFVSDVSHELRTPLTTVRMAADVLHESQDESDPVVVRSSQLLQNELDRFEELLTELLEISRFDAGAEVLSTDEVDLVSLVEDEIQGMARFAELAGSRLIVIAPREVIADVDARRIRRIIRNLLSNAIEHGEGRPIDVTVRGNSTTAAVGVRDRGIGLSPEDAERVFNRFWRADPSRARTLGGTGLGLSISAADARLHGGTLKAWGSPGGGANFVLTIPRRPNTAMAGHPVPLVPFELRQGIAPTTEVSR